MLSSFRPSPHCLLPTFDVLGVGGPSSIYHLPPTDFCLLTPGFSSECKKTLIRKARIV
jgi:hypothetical protein